MDKKNIPVVIGLTIPVIIIILVIAVIFIPRAFAPAPGYNFIYGIGDYFKTFF